MGGVLGGGKSGGSSSQSGYAALSPALKEAFDKLGLGVEQYTNPNIAGNVERFTPLAQTADETNAFNLMRQGFTPTAQSLASDIAMQTNPYDQSVIDTINREAQGQGSVLNQQLSAAGQFGSNRGMLSANDIDLTRLNQIGTFKQSQFNNALNNALNVLPQQRANDAASLLGIGNFQRGLQSQTNLAPISALQAGTGMISPFTSGGTAAQGGSNNGILGGLGNLAQGIGTAWSVFSDIRLKENITPLGMENGFPIYEYNYIGHPKKYIGVMAQEIEEIVPSAVTEVDGWKKVNYDQIGVKFREAKNG